MNTLYEQHQHQDETLQEIKIIQMHNKLFFFLNIYMCVCVVPCIVKYSLE